MSYLDWIILVVTLLLTIVYGVYKSKGQNGVDSFVLAGGKMPWYTVLIGIMATQASAVTFLSGPGQAFSDGMRFVQYYFGLPLAMIFISAVFIPYFQKQKIYTAYQFLDNRFDRKTRVFTSILFLFSRGVSTGISILAPSIVLSALFQWNIYVCNIIIGGFLIIYTFIGGAQAVAQTQKIQFSIILISMLIAGIMIVYKLPEGVTVWDSLYIAGKSNKLNVITTNFDWEDKYNIWSGVIGGFFLALSYFGTDQSQVGRYLSGKDLKQARLGILLNGIVKIPMQFFILLIGSLLFSFFIFNMGPIFYNDYALGQARTVDSLQMKKIEQEFFIINNHNSFKALDIVGSRKSLSVDEMNNKLVSLHDGVQYADSLRKSVSNVLINNNVAVDKKDTNYVFLYFVKHYLPVGLVGLIFAIIFLASWGSISAALNSLASTTLIDLHILFHKGDLTKRQELFWGRFYTLIWGILCILIAFLASDMSSLIEAVNVLGSLFYGAMLGIFLVAFLMKWIKGTAVFYAAIISEIAVFIFYNQEWVGFLWLNVIGALTVLIIAPILQCVLNIKKMK